MNKNEKQPRFQDGLKQVDAAIHGPIQARALFLILDGVDTNVGIAKALDQQQKVTSMHLRRLREAGIIKRVEREGREQPYQVDWDGILKILKYHKHKVLAGKTKSVFVRFGVSNLYEPYCRPNEKLENLQKAFDKILVDAFLKEFFYKAKEELKKPYYSWDFSEEKRKILEKKPNNFNLVDFDIEYLLKVFDRGLMDYSPTVFMEELKKLNNDSSIKEGLPSAWFFLNHFITARNSSIRDLTREKVDEALLLQIFDKNIKTLKDHSGASFGFDAKKLEYLQRRKMKTEMLLVCKAKMEEIDQVYNKMRLSKEKSNETKEEKERLAMMVKLLEREKKEIEEEAKCLEVELSKEQEEDGGQIVGNIEKRTSAMAQERAVKR